MKKLLLSTCLLLTLGTAGAHLGVDPVGLVGAGGDVDAGQGEGAGAAVGVAQAALDEAVAHASGREQFGMPLARLGPVPAMLAQSLSLIHI